ncbi:MAG: hypothetical protein ABIO31_02445 [Candidatus Nitrotoga sp.]
MRHDRVLIYPTTVVGPAYVLETRLLYALDDDLSMCAFSGWMATARGFT